MNQKYEQYLDRSDPDNPVFRATRIGHYCVFTQNVMTAAHVARQLDDKVSRGTTIKPRGSVVVRDQVIEYTTIASDIEL